jgi:acyl carrier protein
MITSIDKNLNYILKNKLNLDNKKIKSNDYLDQDIMDSFNIIILITEIEKKFKIKINPDKFNIKNFQNFKTIVKFIEKNKIK